MGEVSVGDVMSGESLSGESLSAESQSEPSGFGGELPLAWLKLYRRLLNSPGSRARIPQGCFLLFKNWPVGSLLALWKPSTLIKFCTILVETEPTKWGR